MTITYNPNDGFFLAVGSGKTLAEGQAPQGMNLEEFLNHLLREIEAGLHSK